MDRKPDHRMRIRKVDDCIPGKFAKTARSPGKLRFIAVSGPTIFLSAQACTPSPAGLGSKSPKRRARVEKKICKPQYRKRPPLPTQQTFGLRPRWK